MAKQNGSLTISEQSRLFSVEQFAQIVVSKRSGKQGVHKQYIYDLIAKGKELPLKARLHKIMPSMMIIEVPISEIPRIELEKGAAKKGKSK